jgi:glycosyltransferase involved in cell wall biosynthesis
MSVYNGEPYLSQAIESILSQRFDDFEFIIVDDGSTDSSPMVMETFAKKDVRIRLLRNDSNSGLITSLNKAFQAAKGEYIARQDADDISFPERLACQVKFLNERQHIGLAGTWMVNIDQSRQRRIVWKTPLNHHLIKWSLLFGTSIAHATVMMRRSVLGKEDPYRAQMMHAEDYDLWSRLSERTQMANVPFCYYLRRLHDERVSVRHHRCQEQTVKAVMRRNMENLLQETVSDELLEVLRKAYRGELITSREKLQAVVRLIMELYEAYVVKHSLDAAERKEIAYDAACFLTRIGLKHMGTGSREATCILWRAICLARRIPLNTFIACLCKS